MVCSSSLNFTVICKTKLNVKTKLGPVVQSIVSLMSLLRGQLFKCFTTLLPNTPQPRYNTVGGSQTTDRVS